MYYFGKAANYIECLPYAAAVQDVDKSGRYNMMCELSNASDATVAELRHGLRAIAELRRLEDVCSSGRAERQREGRAVAG